MLEPASKTIALLVPVTSRGRRIEDVAETDFARTLLPSFVSTATWDEAIAYRVYLGCDEGDPFYDRPDTQAALAAAFERAVEGRRATLIVRASAGTEHAPAWVWNRLFEEAYRDGCDYFYQLGDDVALETAGWAEAFPAALAGNAAAPGMGVAGPLDGNNPLVLTQSFVSRVHMEIFGTYYPESLKSWWSDDWIREVYWPEHVFWQKDVLVRNVGGRARYRIDASARRLLADEIGRGWERARAWLARRRGTATGRRIIAFSLWGDDPTYTVGAIRNAELALDLYPGWTCRFYCASSVPAPILERLGALPNTEIVRVAEPGDWRAMFWRFLPASEPDVEIVLSRDTDSRLGARERDAVNEWLAGDARFHVMRDHPQHDVPILGGMWGARGGVLRDMRKLLVDNVSGNFWKVDQELLRAVVHPIVRDDACVHDEIYEGRPFPTPRAGSEFVGEAFDEHDHPLHAEHRRVLDRVLGAHLPLDASWLGRRSDTATDLICLAMIVKDEAETIEKTLASAAPFVDRWVIVDTGSTDGTQEVARRALAGIPGELCEAPFVDFATTRNHAMDLCGTASEFVLWLDAEDTLVGGGNLRAHLLAERYGDGEAWEVRRRLGAVFDAVRVARARAGWRFVGAVHEVLRPPPGRAVAPRGRIPGVELVHARTTRSLERTQRRFERDLELLERALRDDPRDARAAFYLARTLAALGRDDEAVAAYERRIAMGGFPEEVFHATLAIATIDQKRGRPWGDVMDRLLEAHERAPHRAEPLYALALQYQRHGQHATALLFAKRGYELPYPKGDRLFVDEGMYRWKMADLVASSASYAGELELGEEAARKALAHRPHDPRLKKNLDFYLERKRRG